MTYAAAELYEQVAYVAFHFHWDLDAIVDLEHLTRQRFVGDIARLRAEG
jgi:hypothetical protein